MDKVKTILTLIILLPALIQAQDRIEIETTIIRGNKKLPKVLYIVPWKDIKHSKKAERKLVLHSLFGDLFEPVVPEQH